MKKTYRSTAVRISILAMFIFFAAAFAAVQLRRNELSDQLSELEMMIDEMNETIYELEADIARPFDDEYIAEIAHEQLGLCYPQEIIFVSGDSN